jgi:adenosylcobyric acid synthase
MIQGTGSGVGKSVIAMALCRIFSNHGIKVSPFKAQNMALNSFITLEGGEIGRAQALQAEAARVEPSIHMNPVLLKASGDMGSQVIIHGKVHSNMKAKEYYLFRKEAWAAAKDSFDRLASIFDLIILEGAGSPAEINLMEVDIVNMRAAEYAGAPVLLVGDIDRGGVFASLYGTLKLVGNHSRRIKGFIINKFRGDIEILKPGLELIRQKTKRPVIGVLPYVDDMGLPEEDGLSLKDLSRGKEAQSAELRIVVVRLRYISNFTDFDPLRYEPDVEMLYSNNPDDIENADLVIVPGSKNTAKDLLELRKNGTEDSILRAHRKGITVVGICGGYQMLGKVIRDPLGIESEHKEIKGIGLLDIETVFNRQKTTCQIRAVTGNHGMLKEVTNLHDCGTIKGYEIHMGESVGNTGLFFMERINGSGGPIADGTASENCWGTYIHGIFDNDQFRRSVLNRIRLKKGLRAVDFGTNYQAIKESAIERTANMVREGLDMPFIERLLRL